MAATPPVRVHACQSLERTRFANIAPAARIILVFQIESLELSPESIEGIVHAIKGKIRVLRKYRESKDDFLWVRFDNTMCHGRRLDVGGIYLNATNSSAPLIELGPADGLIVQLAGAFPFDPEYILRGSPTINRLLEALSGKGDFDIGTDVERWSMSRELAPPPPCLGIDRFHR
jgi:hypothetical protein